LELKKPAVFLLLKGPEFGGAIGIMLTLANAMGAAMETIGFCEAFLDMLIRDKCYKTFFGVILQIYPIS
jgi:hypothetical protein